MLAQAIVREGMKSVSAGISPMDLKRGIDLAVTRVVADLQARSKPVANNDEIAQVAAPPPLQLRNLIGSDEDLFLKEALLQLGAVISPPGPVDGLRDHLDRDQPVA